MANYKKLLVKKGKVNFKIYDALTWLTNNYNAHISNISRSKGNQNMKSGQLIEHNEKYFSSIIIQKMRHRD